jgi:hypothetical protein
MGHAPPFWPISLHLALAHVPTTGAYLHAGPAGLLPHVTECSSVRPCV